MVKEAKRVIPEEQIEQHIIGLAKALFAEPEAPGVATNVSMHLELELRGVDRGERRPIATTLTGKIVRGELTGIFPMTLQVNIKKLLLPDGTDLYYRSDIKPQSAQAHYTAYKELLDAEIAEKRRPAQKRRETQEKRNRKRREEAKAAVQAERKPPSVLLNFISYSSGTPVKERQSKAAIIREALKEKGKDSGFLVRETSDPTNLFEDKSARLLAPEMVDRILEKGLTPEQFERVVTVTRKRLVDKLREMEAFASQAAMDMIAGMAKSVRTASGKDLVHVISIQRTIAPFLYAHLSYFSGGDSPYFKNETDFLIQADFGPNYPNLSYVNGLMHRFALRFASKTLEGHRDMLEGSQEPAAAFLLGVLNQNNHDDIIALKQGAAAEVEGKIIHLADLDAFLAPIILDDALLVHTIFADVLGALFPLPYTLNGDERELGLIRISRMVEMLFAGEEILQLLAPDQIDPLSQQDIIGELKNQIRALENEQKNIRGSGREVSQKRNALNKEIKDLYGLLRRTATAGGKKETRGEKIKRLLRERIPEAQPNPKNYQDGEDSPVYRAALRKYRQLSTEQLNLFKQPDPADYQGGVVAKAYQEESFLYSTFRRLANPTKTTFMNRDALVPSFSF